jgi:hypothetical protein
MLGLPMMNSRVNQRIQISSFKIIINFSGKICNGWLKLQTLWNGGKLQA